MVTRRGNPFWVPGISGNPKGRSKGQSSVEAFQRNPFFFLIRHRRWERFCWSLMEPPYTGAAAARRAGYSHKSARFIASRLRKKPVIREIFREIRDLCHSSKIYRNSVSGKRFLIRAKSPLYDIDYERSKNKKKVYIVDEIQQNRNTEDY